MVILRLVISPRHVEQVDAQVALAGDHVLDLRGRAEPVGVVLRPVQDLKTKVTELLTAPT